MTGPNGPSASYSPILDGPRVDDVPNVGSNPVEPVPSPEVVTRAKLRVRQQIQPNRFIIIGAGGTSDGAACFCGCLCAEARGNR